MGEIILAHAVGNDLEAAHRRGEMFNKRRKLMSELGHYCSSYRKTEVPAFG